MKRKFKDFLNKRVISGTLSVAMAFFVEKYSPFYEGDDLWNIIIEKATSSRDAVNTLFGLE